MWRLNSMCRVYGEWKLISQDFEDYNEAWKHRLIVEGLKYSEFISLDKLPYEPPPEMPEIPLV